MLEKSYKETTDREGGKEGGEREGARGVRERENEESSQPSFVISNTAVTSHMQLFKFKLIKMIKFKNLLFSHTSHISSA